MKIVDKLTDVYKPNQRNLSLDLSSFMRGGDASFRDYKYGTDYSATTEKSDYQWDYLVRKGFLSGAASLGDKVGAVVRDIKTQETKQIGLQELVDGAYNHNEENYSLTGFQCLNPEATTEERYDIAKELAFSFISGTFDQDFERDGYQFAVGNGYGNQVIYEPGSSADSKDTWKTVTDQAFDILKTDYEVLMLSQNEPDMDMQQ